MIILGNDVFASTIAKTLVKNVEGFVTFYKDAALIVTDLGVEPFIPKQSDQYVLGDLSVRTRRKYLSFISQYINVTAENFPNIVAPSVNTDCLAIIGYGNVISHNVTIQEVSINNFNYFGTGAVVNSWSIIGSHNVMREYISIGYNCAVGDLNILDPKAIITDNISIGNSNIISHAECLFEPLHNNELFRSGIIEQIKCE